MSKRTRHKFLPFTNMSLFIVLLTIFIVLGLTYIPWIVFWLVVASFFGILIRGILQFCFGFLRVKKLSLKKLSKERFISVHVPSHNEPVEILKNTLLKLSQQNYSNFEVIVIDNNTKDPAVWEPIQVYCQLLGNKFRFYHVENLKGYKAGALNYIKDKSNPNTECIAIVDADYEVSKNFLTEANKYFTDKKIGFIQFPQAYKNVTKKNIGLDLEYQHFFFIYMNMANYFNCVTATGTLSVFRVDALRKVGFFNSDSITEDSDIGVRLNKVGYSGVYVPKVVGKGLMPYDLASYKKQKTRWASGNMQVLRNNFFSILFDKNMTLRQKIGLFSQLTAWVNFTFFPVLTILIASLLRLIDYQYYPMMRFIVFLSAISLITFLVLKFLSLYMSFKYTYPFSYIIKAFFVHIGLSGVYSVALMRIILKSNLIFERTNKYIFMNVSGIIQNAFIELVISIGSFLLSFYHLFESHYVYGSVLFLLGSMYLLIIYVNNEFIITQK